ncbi:MAG: hypothetical protein HOO97_10115 [Sideroxydans sp.]|nr:hypothetical protein [Sideroxydans sp.]
MKTNIQVISTENRKGRSKTGNDYDMNICQCVVHEETPEGLQKKIGELVLPKGHPVVSEGMYEGHFGISIGQDKRISGRLIQLTPLRTAVPAAGAGAKP